MGTFRVFRGKRGERAEGWVWGSLRFGVRAVLTDEAEAKATSPKRLSVGFRN